MSSRADVLAWFKAQGPLSPSPVPNCDPIPCRVVIRSVLSGMQGCKMALQAVSTIRESVLHRIKDLLLLAKVFVAI